MNFTIKGVTMNPTKEYMQYLNEYLAEVIKNSYRCEHCVNNHDFCFFAYECIKHDFEYFDDGD